MKILFWIAFKLRLRQKFWGDWFIKWHGKQVRKALNKIDIDTSNINLTNSQE